MLSNIHFNFVYFDCILEKLGKPPHPKDKNAQWSFQADNLALLTTNGYDLGKR